MQQFTDVIMQFVNKMGYLRSKDIEGIIFYGSNQTGFGNQFSDIDLHIIFNNNLKEEIYTSIYLFIHSSYLFIFLFLSYK